MKKQEFQTSRCPFCGASPLEVTGQVSKAIEGCFDDEGILEVATVSEEIVYLSCISCNRNLVIEEVLKGWE